MAKSARSSSRKAAKTKLRNSVYAPVEQARLERLSQRLRESIAASSSSGAMDVEREESTTTATTPTAATTSRSDAASSGAIQEGEVFDAQGSTLPDASPPSSPSRNKKSALSRATAPAKRKVSKSRKALVFSSIGKKSSKTKRRGSRIRGLVN